MSAPRVASKVKSLKRREQAMLVFGAADGLYMSAMVVLHASGTLTLLTEIARHSQLPGFGYLFPWVVLPAAGAAGFWIAFVICRYGRIRSELAADPYYLVCGRPYVDFALSDEEFGTLCETMSKLSAASSATDQFYVRLLKRYVWHLRNHWLPSPGAVQITRALTVMAEQELRRYEGHGTRTKAKEGRPG